MFGTVQQNRSSECIHLGGAAVPQRQHCQRSARLMADVEKMDVEVRLRLADVPRIAGPPRRPWIPRPSRESPASSPAAWAAPTVLACPGRRWGLHTCDEEPCARCEHRWTRRVPTSKARAASQGRGELQTQAQGGGVCEGQRVKGGVRRCPWGAQAVQGVARRAGVLRPGCLPAAAATPAAEAVVRPRCDRGGRQTSPHRRYAATTSTRSYPPAVVGCP